MEKLFGFRARRWHCGFVLVCSADGAGRDGDRFALSRVKGKRRISRAARRAANRVVDSGLCDGGILRGDDFSRVFAEAIYCVEWQCGGGSGRVRIGVWGVPRVSGSEACGRHHGVWIDVRDSGAVETEFAPWNDDACTARYGEWDCGEVFEVEESRKSKGVAMRRCGERTVFR